MWWVSWVEGRGHVSFKVAKDLLNLQIILQVEIIGKVKNYRGVGGWDHEGPVGYDGGKYEIRGANTL